MSKTYEKLLENSLHAALSSIEIYNKPDFKYREQIFTILNINAWELLLKAKILKDADDDESFLYIYFKDGRIKTNRSGNPMTIEIKGAMRKLSLESTLSDNLDRLIEIRDTVVHFFHDEVLSYLVYTLGVASLKNYEKLMKDWFERSLLEYNFYIMPLAFAYNFKTLSTLDLETKPDAIANLIQSVTETQSSKDPSDDFYFVCEVATEVKSAKRFSGDFTTAVGDPSEAEILTVIKPQPVTETHPYSFTDMWEKIREEKPNANKNDVHAIIKEHKIKHNSRFSQFNFRSRKQKENYRKTGEVPQGTSSSYNQDAVRFILEHIEG